MADKGKSDGDTYLSSRPEKVGAWLGFKQFLWRSDTKQFMGRTADSWSKLKFIGLARRAEREKFIALDFWRPSHASSIASLVR
jgi:hypothetical protein